MLLYCLPGLVTLQEIAERCVTSQVNLSGMEVFGGESVLTISRPNKTINCDHTFGEIYVTLSCAGYCENSICPFKNKIQYNSCPRQYLNRVYAVADNSFITFVNNRYKNDYFRCDNNICINYNQVCNVVLVDDCGDGSDEVNCSTSNVLQRDSREQVIPITEKCDGNTNCQDLSDECNSDCGKDILQNRFLKVLCWVLALLAI